MRIADTHLGVDANLQGYWRLDGDFTDSSVNAYTLTANNAPVVVAGRFGQGYDFESGSSQSATILDASCPNLEIAGSQSWVCWVNSESFADYQCPMGKFGVGVDKTILIGAGGVPYFTIQGLTTNIVVTGSIVLTLGSWYHVAGVYNSATTTLKVYVNGAQSGSVTASGSATDTNGAFAIGKRGGGLLYFDGLIDEAAIFNRALTPSEISLLYIDGGRFLMDL